MGKLIILLALVWLIAGCQAGADPLPTPTSSAPPDLPEMERNSTATPALAESTPADLPPPAATSPTRPSLKQQPDELGPGETTDPGEDSEIWESGGPGKAPKPSLDLSPQYAERLEPYSPFRQPPQLPEIPTQTPEPQVLLPDLYTLPPYDLRLLRDLSSDRVIIRFSSAIANIGPGALELRGWMDSSSGIVDVSQLIFTETEGEEPTYPESGVGQFYYHGEHEHWHWDGFSLYEVYSALPDGSMGELIYSSDKVGYCLRDDDRVENLAEELTVDNPMQFETQARRYQACGPTIQGLSTGWADIYAHNTPGQWVDVSGVIEGDIYALRSTANPYNLIQEVDQTNNTAVVYFRLQGTQVELVESPFIADPTEVNE
jgi:hypothetical protein